MNTSRSDYIKFIQKFRNSGLSNMYPQTKRTHSE